MTGRVSRRSRGRNCNSFATGLMMGRFLRGESEYVAASFVLAGLPCRSRPDAETGVYCPWQPLRALSVRCVQGALYQWRVYGLTPTERGRGCRGEWMMGPRITCAIAGCKRTAANPKGWTGWICADHWKLAPTSWRRRCTMFRRIMRSPNPARAQRAASALDRCWARCRSHIEAKCADGAPPDLMKFIDAI